MIKKRKKLIVRSIKVLFTLVIIGISFITVFFKTEVFAKERDLWVQTAMSTSNHKYLATWFLSDDEIDTILEKYEVTNTTNSSDDSVDISNNSNNVTYEEISGDTYKGYVVIVDDPSSVSLIDTRNGNSGSTLGETVSSTNATVAINAGGFGGSRRNNNGGALNSLTIIDGQLLYGDENTKYDMVGFTKEGKLVLGNYTYQEALKAGIDDAITFGPYIIVNGENQVTNESSGGLQPRTAIGQTKDGKLIFVVIDGRSSESLGANYYDLQEIFEKYGAVNATNLDGGGSSTMYYDGSLVNSLSEGSERKIPTAIIAN